MTYICVESISWRLLNRSPSLLLDNCSAGRDTAPVGDVTDAEAHKIATPQFTIDGQIEQGEVPSPFNELETDPNGPNLLPFERRLLAG